MKTRWPVRFGSDIGICEFCNKPRTQCKKSCSKKRQEKYRKENVTRETKK